MSSSLIIRAKKALEGQIDFQGQTTAERVAQLGLVLSAIIAFIVGVVGQDIRFSLAVFALGTLATFFAVVPPWGYLNRHPVSWRSTAVQAKKDL